MQTQEIIVPVTNPPKWSASEVVDQLNDLYPNWLRTVGLGVAIVSLGVFGYLQVAATQDEAADSQIRMVDTLLAQSSPAEAKVLIHLTGQVSSPGVVELEADSRVLDAIKLAGGPTDEADLSRINLAGKLQDGTQIRVPAVGEDVSTAVNVFGAEGQKLISINAASATELQTLPGVGPATASRIVDYRESNGPFVELADLMSVPGIGSSKFEQLKVLATI